MLPTRSRFSFIALLCLSCGAVAQPAPSVDGLRDRYPSGSIDSVEKADAALTGTAGAKVRVDKEFKAAARACIGRVLVNQCLEENRDVRRKRMADVDAIELEANRFKRRDRNDRLEEERGKRENERTVAAPADAVARETRRKAYEQKQATARRDAADRAKSDAARIARPTKPMITPRTPADAAARESEREKNAIQFEKKQRDAMTHRTEIDRRLVQKTADRKRREEAKAVKDAKTAAAAQAALLAAPGAKP